MTTWVGTTYRRTLLVAICAAFALVGGVQSGSVAAPVPASVVAAAAQPGPPDVPAQVAAMARLDFMLGRWAGAGWILGEDGVRREFTQTEHVERQVGGSVVSIEGEGRAADDPSRVVASALAVISYDDRAQVYRWEAFSRGSITEVEPVVGDNLFQWTLEVPGATVRYTLTFTDQQWFEIGEVTLDGGQTWRQVFEMTLHRVK